MFYRTLWVNVKKSNTILFHPTDFAPQVWLELLGGVKKFVTLSIIEFQII